MTLLLLAAAALALTPAGSAESAVRELYRHVVARKPLGIPAGADRNALWPLLTPRLRGILETAEACERDYLRQHATSDEKPEYPWLELGLFSGGNEMAVPASVEVADTRNEGGGRYRVDLRFAYRDERGATFTWDGSALVACQGSTCLVDDFVPAPVDGVAAPRLSATFAGCDGKRWVGAPE
jgi:hypothetical protein